MQGMKKEIIVIDYGTSNVRVNMIDTATGDIVHSKKKKYAMEDKGMGYAEISTNDLWMHSVSCMKKVMDSLGVDEEYVALSFSFFGDNLIPVDCDGNALNDCILCMDARGEQEMCEINESIPKEQQIDEKILDNGAVYCSDRNFTCRLRHSIRQQCKKSAERLHFYHR